MRNVNPLQPFIMRELFKKKPYIPCVHRKCILNGPSGESTQLIRNTPP